jgi:hypothetical protein
MGHPSLALSIQGMIENISRSCRFGRAPFTSGGFIETLAISITVVLSASLDQRDRTALAKEERAHAIQLLRDSQTEFLNLTSGLSEAQWTYKPAPDRWSVGETAQHIVMAEGMLFSKLDQLWPTQQTLTGRPRRPVKQNSSSA